MKTTVKISGVILIAALFLVSNSIQAMGAKEEIIDTINFNAYYGKVVDKSSGRVLPFSTVEAVGSNAATVTNIDGEFAIKIAKSSTVSELKISSSVPKATTSTNVVPF